MLTLEESIKILEDYSYALITISSSTEKDKKLSEAIKNVLDRNKYLEENRQQVKNQIEDVNINLGYAMEMLTDI